LSYPDYDVGELFVVGEDVGELFVVGDDVVGELFVVEEDFGELLLKRKLENYLLKEMMLTNCC